MCLALVPRLAGQSPAPAPLDWWSEDSVRIAFVRAHGQARIYPAATVWAPADSLDPAWYAGFADSLGAAVAQLRALVGGPLPWQRIGRRPLVFILAPGRFISHSTGQDTVLIPLERVRSGTAPLLHEASHELLAPPLPFFPYEYPDTLEGERKAAEFPSWLSEGLPDYLAQTVAQRTGFREGDVFATGGLARVDSTCRTRLSGHLRRREIAARIGGAGRLEALFTSERATVAPTFYTCSLSFTRFLADRVGLRALIELMPLIPSGRWTRELETRAAGPLPALRKAWLAALNVPDDDGP